MTLVVLEPILIPAGGHILPAGPPCMLQAGPNLGVAVLVVIPALQVAGSALTERRSENNRERK